MNHSLVPADDSHEISSLILFLKARKNLSMSSAVTFGGIQALNIMFCTIQLMFNSFKHSYDSQNVYFYVKHCRSRSGAVLPWCTLFGHIFFRQLVFEIKEHLLSTCYCAALVFELFLFCALLNKQKMYLHI